MLGQMMNAPMLISNLIEFAARFHGDVEIVTRTVEGPVVRTTWAGIAERSRRLGNALTKLGVKPGDRIATIAWNTQRHLELYFAVSGLGAVLHTINPRLPLDQLAYVADHAEDQLLFYDLTFAKLARYLQTQGNAIRAYVAMSDAECIAKSPDQVPGALAYEDLITPESSALTWPELDENTASSLCYTSGTAGNPKGVLYSHRSTVLHSYASAMVDSIGICRRDVTLPVVPMFHVNAWGVPYSAAMVGSKLVLPGPGLDGKSLLELIESEHVSFLLGVPTVWLALLNHCAAAGKRLDSVEKVTIGGSACPPSMIEAFERDHGARVIHAWGMTETSPVGTVNTLLPKHVALDHAAQLAVKAKQGRPLFGIDLRLVDDAGEVQPHDGRSSGHLQARGAWVASGYFKRDNDDTHHDGWFYTGDIATIDGDGYMQITDRSKDVIKSGGEWVSSIDLENAAMAHPTVLQAAAIGVPHTKWQERPLLIVVAKAGQTIDKAALMTFLETRLVKWWLPDAIEIVDALPLGATGKVLKRELRTRFADYKLG